MSENNYGLPSPLTKQTIFDKVATHLLRQGRASYNPAVDICAYRGPNGTACAVGCLIADSDYHTDLEGKSARQVAGAVDEPLLSSRQQILILKPFWLLLEMLQSVHDNWDLDADASAIIEDLRGVADKFDLSADILSRSAPWSAPQAVEQIAVLPTSLTRLLSPVAVEAEGA